VVSKLRPAISLVVAILTATVCTAACRTEAPLPSTTTGAPTVSAEGSASVADLNPQPAQSEEGSASDSTPTATGLEVQPQADVMWVIGDVHGDLPAMNAALQLAGAIDAAGHWASGNDTVVFVGDLLDRGADDAPVLNAVRRLQSEAAEVGGTVHCLLGNHEIMNVAGDFRYVAEAAWQGWPTAPAELILPEVPDFARDRVAAFRPGGDAATWLQTLPVFLVVGDTLFVHGGLLPAHVDYGLAQINQEVSAWIAGQTPNPPQWAASDNSPVWTRVWSLPEPPPDCAALTAMLDSIDVDRMVVGHTVQEQGMNAACDGRVWRADAGISAHYGGNVQVLRATREEWRPVLPAQ
jgi:hypothetical protein